MGFLIDSSIIIAAERGKLDFEALLQRYPGQPAAFAAVTASELLHGVFRAQPAERRAKRLQFVEALLSRIPVTPFGLDEARVHARVHAELAAAGRTIGAHDLLIAATALRLNWAVLTRDQRSFPHVPGLTFELI